MTKYADIQVDKVPVKVILCQQCQRRGLELLRTAEGELATVCRACNDIRPLGAVVTRKIVSKLLKGPTKQ